MLKVGGAIAPPAPPVPAPLRSIKIGLYDEKTTRTVYLVGLLTRLHQKRTLRHTHGRRVRLVGVLTPLHQNWTL